MEETRNVKILIKAINEKNKSDHKTVDRNIRILKMIERIVEILPTKCYKVLRPCNYTYSF
jgi:hypothetical protein